MTSWFAEVNRAAELGLDLDHQSDLALIRIYLVELSHGRFNEVSRHHRAELRRMGVITVRDRGHRQRWCLTAKGLGLVAEVS